MMRFNDKVAVVTGAGQGIGETYAKRLAQEGAVTIVAEINEAQGERVAAEIRGAGGKAAFIRVDVSDPQSCLALAASVQSQFGGAQLLINNAAIFAGMRWEPILTVDIDYYLKLMAVNLHGPLFMSRALAPQMVASGGGAIVNQSSAGAFTYGPTGSYYSVSKLAVSGMTMALAAELGPQNVRVNAVAPGPTSTEAMRAVDPKNIAAALARMPLGRVGSPDDQADAALYLLSDAAAFITGQTLFVDGGTVRRV